MNKKIGIGVVALAGVITGSALADVIVSFSGDLGALEAIIANVGVPLGGLSGVSVVFDYGEPVSDGSWASDVQMIISDGDTSFTVGGFTNIGDADVAWAFDGAGSDGPGVYSDSFSDADFPQLNTIGDGGTLDISWANDWSADPNPNSYNVTIILEGIVPAPGALALLGVAGLATRRRRRS